MTVARMRERRATAEVVITLSVALLACGAPQSKYRHSGETPAPRALTWDGHAVGEGKIRVEGAYTRSSLDRNDDPALEDTAIHIPEHTVDAVATIGLSSQVELGARVSYAAYSWTQPTAEGTMSIPGHPAVWGVGPEVRWAIPIDDGGHFKVGLALNALHYTLPVARWTQADCSDPATCTCPPGEVCETSPSDQGLTIYQLSAEGSESEFVYNAAVYPSVSFGPEGKFGHLFFGASAHEAFKNRGFTNELSDTEGSTLEKDDTILLAGAGYGIEFQGLLASGMLYVPLGDNSVDYGPGYFVTLGGALPVWDPAEQP